MVVATLPKSLNDVTLAQWVAWNTIYGKALSDKLLESQTDPDKMLLFETEFALKHYAHYSNTPVIDIDDMLANDPATVVEIVKEAGLSQAMMFREMCDIPNTDFKAAVFTFDGREWHIVPPVHIDADTKLSVADFERCQDIALILSDLQDGKFEAMYEMCAEYLRPVNGPIGPEISMTELPLYIALCVKSYVSQTINLFNQLSHDRTTVAT